LTLMGGYVLGVVTSGGAMDQARWIFVLQLGTLGAAVWVGLCLASRFWIATWREDEQNLSAKPLMRLQLGMSVLGNAILLLSLLASLFVMPAAPLSAWQVQVGHVAGWLALVASTGVIFWYTSTAAPRQRVHVFGCFALSLAALAASVFNPFALGWVSYHALLAAGSVAALAFH